MLGAGALLFCHFAPAQVLIDRIEDAISRIGLQFLGHLLFLEHYLSVALL